MRPHVIKLGNNPDVQSVDSRRFLNEEIWGILAEEYNKKDHPDLGTFLRDDNFYVLAQILEDKKNKKQNEDLLFIMLR
jgi:hypothetical protein